MDQQLRLARLVLESVEGPNQTVTVDLVFQGNQIKRGQEYYGVWRDSAEGAICPFVMDPDGNCDFGTGYSGEDRVYEFDIYQVQLGQGVEVGWRSGDFETAMKLTGITQLV